MLQRSKCHASIFLCWYCVSCLNLIFSAPLVHNPGDQNSHRGSGGCGLLGHTAGPALLREASKHEICPCSLQRISELCQGALSFSFTCGSKHVLLHVKLITCAAEALLVDFAQEALHNRMLDICEGKALEASMASCHFLQPPTAPATTAPQGPPKPPSKATAPPRRCPSMLSPGTDSQCQRHHIFPTPAHLPFWPPHPYMFFPPPPMPPPGFPPFTFPPTPPMQPASFEQAPQAEEAQEPEEPEEPEEDADEVNLCVSVM